MGFHIGSLPDFPWDSLLPARKRAAEHPRGAVDLTIGTPVDNVPSQIQEILRGASNKPGYPPAIGIPPLREAIASWLSNQRGVNVQTELGILPTIGSKEFVALLPSLMGLGADDVVAFPAISYPTYDVGARLAGATPLPIDPHTDPDSWPEGISLLWLNSPGNPDGHVLDVAQLQRIVAWARRTGTVVASDECYAELTWDVPEAPSILDTRVCGTDTRDLICVYSLSKQSNLAGYRAAFAAGDPRHIATITEIRKHAGFLMPAPVQEAMAFALTEKSHVSHQHEIYRKRRTALHGVLASAGLVADPKSVAGLYLWVCGAPEYPQVDCARIVAACAELGIIVTPGSFYGSAGEPYVRISLTATDEAIGEAVRRLPGLPAQLWN